ncbi:adenine nucleotide alpha hydrolase [Acuticoccus sp. MNP-M23]|uniref:adenine nucleotide alpha hydrolase n=1 Tax=Acuticoccus sp. MNP-M23 TaxID=3072793 RepID=UPI00281696F2|nr:adenine nucleotide alpha hydrolase [Acuticoccus sp. MNP-M23]WMS43419.1 adenine nucleotide alpha hydrolase [Acuticoccus sp. MNP-M23]
MSAEAAILAAIARHDALAIAVSGGVDSMLLAHLAHRTGAAVKVVHAVSFAVPEEATARVKVHATRHGWDLALVDAGELADPQYTANPVNRCYFCKSNLYSRIRSVTDATIASGANTDDLGDFRPGLLAAAERSVVHPFVEAGAGKAVIYALAAELGLGDIAALPAQPCLASRIETGITVTPETLTFIDETERTLRPLLGAGAALRCRVTAAGVAVEVAPTPPPAAATAAHSAAADICAMAGRPFLGLKPYQRGSAFLTGAA